MKESWIALARMTGNADRRETDIWREEGPRSKGGPLSWGIIKDRQLTNKTKHLIVNEVLPS